MALLTGEVDASWKADAVVQVEKGADGACSSVCSKSGRGGLASRDLGGKGGAGQAEDLVMPRWGLAVNESKIKKIFD